MEGQPRATKEYPALLTNAVLDTYARYIAARARAEEAQPTSADVRGSSPAAALPGSLEEALAPLEVLHGKTALSAIGIALHGAEPVIRYAERADASAGESDAEERTSDDEEGYAHGAPPSQAPATASHPATVHPAQQARWLYQVGEHTLFSPYYCPCSAYAYQSIQRQEVWCCKHLLALQLVLRVEAYGVSQDNLRVRVVEAAEYERLLQQAL